MISAKQAGSFKFYHGFIIPSTFVGAKSDSYVEPDDKAEEALFGSLVYEEIDASGGALIMHAFQPEIDATLPTCQQRDRFSQYFVDRSFEEDPPGIAKYAITVIHGGADSIPQLLPTLVAATPTLPVKVGSMIQKADVESTTFDKFWQAVQQTYSNGTYRVGPLLQMSIVGRVGEETGAYYADLLDTLERHPVIGRVLPWSSRSILSHMAADRTRSDDGPILWSRPGEQIIPASELVPSVAALTLTATPSKEKERDRHPNNGSQIPTPQQPQQPKEVMTDSSSGSDPSDPSAAPAAVASPSDTPRKRARPRVSELERLQADTKLNARIRNLAPREHIFEDRTRPHADQVGYGPERATTAAVGFLQGIHPEVAASSSGNPDADAKRSCPGPGAPESAAPPPKSSRALFKSEPEPEHGTSAATSAPASGAAAVACPSRVAALEGAPARVLKDVVCFHAGSYRQVTDLLQLDLHEPPASQCVSWADEAKLNQLARAGVRYAHLQLHEGDLYLIPRNVVHQFRSVAAVVSLAWHTRLRQYYRWQPLLPASAAAAATVPAASSFAEPSLSAGDPSASAAGAEAAERSASAAAAPVPESGGGAAAEPQPLRKLKAPAATVQDGVGPGRWVPFPDSADTFNGANGEVAGAGLESPSPSKRARRGRMNNSSAAY